MPLANWYPAGSNQFHQAIFCLAEMKKPTMLSSQLCWVFKTVPHDLVRRIRFLRIKSSEQDFKYLYWTISKTIVRNLFISKGTSVVHWVGWLHVYACVSCSISIVFVYKYVRVPLSSRSIAGVPGGKISWRASTKGNSRSILIKHLQQIYLRDWSLRNRPSSSSPRVDVLSASSYSLSITPKGADSPGIRRIGVIGALVYFLPSKNV